MFITLGYIPVLLFPHVPSPPPFLAKEKKQGFSAFQHTTADLLLSPGAAIKELLRS